MSSGRTCGDAGSAVPDTKSPRSCLVSNTYAILVSPDGDDSGTAKKR
jgi:hypothetical protein